MLGSDGGVFSYANSKFYGSEGAVHLNKPVVGKAATPNGLGYWLVAADGGVFSFGDSRFYGSAVGRGPVAPAVGMAAAPGDPSYINQLIWNGAEYEACDTTGTETASGYTEAQYRRGAVRKHAGRDHQQCARRCRCLHPRGRRVCERQGLRRPRAGCRRTKRWRDLVF